MVGFIDRGTDGLCFVASLAFLAIAALAYLLRGRSQSPVHWPSLSLFGLTQGLYLWLRLVAARSSLPVPIQWEPARLIVLILSLAALIEAGRRVGRDGCPHRGAWIHLPLLALAGLGVLSGTVRGLETACWVAIGLPGALQIAVVLWQTAREETGRVRAALRTTALALPAYAAIAAFPQSPWGAVAVFVATAGLWLFARHWVSTTGRPTWLLRWPGPATFVVAAALGWCILAVSDKSGNAVMAVGELIVGPSAMEGPSDGEPADDELPETELVELESRSAWEATAYRRSRMGLVLLAVPIVVLATCIAVTSLRSAAKNA